MASSQIALPETIDTALANLSRATVIMCGVSNYDQLQHLSGTPSDMEMLADILLENSDVALFDASRVIELENPTSAQFRSKIAEYAQARSAPGDILILYFTGHGCVLPGGSFGFCLRDAKVGLEDRGILPVSVVSIDDVISTLAIYDVHPALILDACFSSTSAPHGRPLAATVVEETMRSGTAESFGLLASSSAFSPSLDTPDGGAFTQALYSIVMNGLPGEEGRRSPFITLDQLAGPLQEELSTLGVPLSRCYVGRDFPMLPIARNAAFRPQSERFTPYMKRIIELLWNDGSPRTAQISEFSSEIGQGAYGNHSKLSRAPWDLVEDAGSNQIRRLTTRGKRFARGKLRISRVIVRNPFTWEWEAAEGSERTSIEEI